MFNRTRFERIYKFLIEHDEEIERLKARVRALEEQKCNCRRVNDE